MSHTTPLQPGLLGQLKAIDRHIQRVEVVVCFLALTAMTLLFCAQIVLRQLIGKEVGGVELGPIGELYTVANVLVIWVCVLGGSLATAEGRHIAIEAVPRLLNTTWRRRIEILVNLISLLVVGTLLILAVIHLVKTEHLFGEEGHEFAFEIDHMLLIVPVGLGLICWRFGLRIAEGLVLDEAEWEELRAEDAGREDMRELDEIQEEQEVELLVQTSERMAAITGEPALDRDSARAEVRRVLKSDRVTAKETSEVATAPAPELPVEDDLASESGEVPPLPPVTPKKPDKKLPPALKSTDEIPVYRDLADDEDLLEPEVQPGAPPVLDSSDDLDAVDGGLDSDTGRAAEDALEAMASRAVTDRIEQSDEAPVERAQVVVIVQEVRETEPEEGA